jgi:Bacteriocin-protection, YdeI or OmpD-Associated/Domain of unknown function (DUF1905)
MINKPLRFVARIYKMGINRCVNLPKEASKALGGSGHVPVVAMVAGRSARTTLVPAGGGRHRLFLNSAMRKAAGVDAGGLVGILLKRDTASRELPLPDELRRVLAKNLRARKAFREITPALRREFLRWVLHAKNPETRERRIRKGIVVLIERASRRRHRSHRHPG